ncbi:MAG: CHASE3 domain-containing protein, partial [Chloroflexi bacterium]|nr:CHASE3 domain-containing protein [Chloroflexota bacterium]
ADVAYRVRRAGNRSTGGSGARGGCPGELCRDIGQDTVGKEKFDAIRALLAGINAKFEAADDLEGQFLMQAITLDLVNMETGQRGFLLTGEDASLDPYTQGQVALTEGIEMLRGIDHEAVGVTDSDVAGILIAVTAWQEAAAQPEIEARIEVRSFPKDMGDVIALVNSGVGKESMDVIRADLGAFFDSEVALNVERAADVAAAATSARTMGIGIAAASIVIMMAIGFFLARSISSGVTTVGKAMQQIAVGDVTVQVNNDSADEIGEMARSYRDMQEYLQEISQLVEQVGDGDLTVDVKPKSEKDALGNALSGMVTNLRGLVGQVQNTAGNLASASGQLSNAAEQAGNATQGISTASQQLAKGAEDQNQGIEQTNNAMQQLSTAIDQIARGSQEQAAGVDQTSNMGNQVAKAIAEVAQYAQGAADGARQANQAAENGRDMVNQTIEGMGKIRSAVEQAAKQIADLGTQSDEIGKIVAVIDDIAAQTNLLALNAAIEAARAGEQGRGFAVVADEVRGLAERVTDATKEIANLVENIQKGVAESVKAVDEGTREVGEGVKLAEQAGEALTNIQTSVAGVTEQVEQISAAAEEVSASSDEMTRIIEGVSSITEQNSAATEQMAASSEEVSRAIDGIASVSEQNSASTQEVSASTEQMGAQVEEVVASSQSLAQMSEDLQEVVGSFNLNGANGGVAVKQRTPSVKEEA